MFWSFCHWYLLANHMSSTNSFVYDLLNWNRLCVLLHFCPYPSFLLYIWPLEWLLTHFLGDCLVLAGCNEQVFCFKTTRAVFQDNLSEKKMVLWMSLWGLWGCLSFETRARKLTQQLLSEIFVVAHVLILNSFLTGIKI